jgi:type I restriction enzyme R subunit
MSLLRDPELQNLLSNYPRPKRTFVVAYETQDTVSSQWLIRDGTGREHKPEDYLSAFTRFVRENPAHIQAIEILLGRPRDWGTDALEELRRKLAATPEQFNLDRLQRAHEVRYHKALVDIISMVKHAARETEPLYTAEERVRQAISRVSAGKYFTAEQQQWLDHIRDHLVANLSIDRRDFDDVPVFTRVGGWRQADRAFEGRLIELVRELNEAIAA